MQRLSSRDSFYAWTVALTLAAGVALFETPAAAQGAVIAPASGRAFFAGAHLGGGIKLKDSVGQFKLGQEFGWHLMSQNHTGPAIGVYLHESFGSSVFTFQIGPKAWWHFQPLANIGLYVGPYVHLGLVHTSISISVPGFGSGSASNTGFNWQLGVDGRLVLTNRFYVLFRPFGLDFFHSDGGTGIRWDLQFGGGVLF